MGFGLYHPSLNASGCMKASDDKFWYDTTQTFNTKADCFNPAKLLAGSGTIASGKSGRPDGKYGDAVYSSGAFGVVDYRLSAYDMSSPEESAKAWEKVKNGTYRGLEKLVYTQFDTQLSSDTPSGWNTEVSNTSRYTVGDICYLEQTDGTYHKIYIVNKTTTHIYWDSARSQAGRKLNGVIVHESELNTSVSGNFTMTDVIGDPANILLTDALKNGWQGSWVPVIPSGVNKEYSVSRKITGGLTVPSTYTNDNGASWNATSYTVDGVTNSLTWSFTTGAIHVWTYTAFAKQTKPSTNKPVLNGEAGVGGVFVNAFYHTTYGALLNETLLGKVAKSNLANQYQGLKVNKFVIDTNLMSINTNTNYPTAHEPTSIGAPQNNSQAVKALPYQISDNGQCSIGIQANGLTWDDSQTIYPLSGSNASWTVGQLVLITSGEFRGFYRVVKSGATLTAVSTYGKGLDGHIYNRDNKTMYFESVDVTKLGWGDDSTMKITDNGSDTFIDLNGNVNLSVSHVLALPIGWSHNRARVSTQTEGVDL